METSTRPEQPPLALINTLEQPGAITFPSIDATTAIIAAYISHNPVSPNQLPGLIAEVHKSVNALFSPTPALAPEPELQPAVPIRKSVTPDAIICLEDGVKLKSLKRHLRVKFDLSPEEYRAKWGLPPEYPMTAPNYSALRSQLAKDNGLGKKG
jgi:predicted transcriptional regulator